MAILFYLIFMSLNRKKIDYFLCVPFFFSTFFHFNVIALVKKISLCICVIKQFQKSDLGLDRVEESQILLKAHIVIFEMRDIFLQFPEFNYLKRMYFFYIFILKRSFSFYVYPFKRIKTVLISTIPLRYTFFSIRFGSNTHKLK